ncbi:MAG: glycosyltransferase, partial [Bacteroidales bacterium]|nr:glycosyltransferase [Bacteroidales bacterium]
MIKFSILLAYWNLDLGLVRRFLESLPDRNDIEIVLIDNASEESVAKGVSVCEGLEDTRLRVVLLKARVSLGECRNIGLQHARGEWILFADLDDAYIPEALNNLLDKQEIAEYDLIYWGTRTLHPNGQVVEDTYGYQPGEEIVPMGERNYLLHHRFESWRKMVRRSFLMQHPEIHFDPCLLCEDYSYCVRLLLTVERVGVFPQLLYQYLRNDASI